MVHLYSQYSSPCNLRPPIQTGKYGLILAVVLKMEGYYTEMNNNGVIILAHVHYAAPQKNYNFQSATCNTAVADREV